MAIISSDPSVTDASVENLVISFFNNPPPPTLDVVVDPPLAGTSSGDVVSVRVSQDFDPIFLGFFKWFDSDLGFIPSTLSYAASGRRM